MQPVSINLQIAVRDPINFDVQETDPSLRFCKLLLHLCIQQSIDAASIDCRFPNRLQGGTVGCGIHGQDPCLYMSLIL